MYRLVVITFFAALTALPASALQQCRQSFYQGSNAALLTGRYVDVAKDNAVLSWGARVLASIGPQYSDWANARDKSFRCVKRAGLNKCTARARPCTKK